MEQSLTPNEKKVWYVEVVTFLKNVILKPSFSYMLVNT